MHRALLSSHCSLLRPWLHLRYDLSSSRSGLNPFAFCCELALCSNMTFLSNMNYKCVVPVNPTSKCSIFLGPYYEITHGPPSGRWHQCKGRQEVWRSQGQILTLHIAGNRTPECVCTHIAVPNVQDILTLLGYFPLQTPCFITNLYECFYQCKLYVNLMQKHALKMWFRADEAFLTHRTRTQGI